MKRSWANRVAGERATPNAAKRTKTRSRRSVRLGDRNETWMEVARIILAGPRRFSVHLARRDLTQGSSAAQTDVAVGILARQILKRALNAREGDIVRHRR